MKKVLYLMLFCAWTPNGLSAQIRTTPVEVDMWKTDFPKSPLAELTDLYLGGEVKVLQEKTRKYLTDLYEAKERPKHYLNFEANHYLVVFLSTKDSTELLRYVVHNKPEPRDYSLTVPGLTKKESLFEVFLSSTERQTYSTTYSLQRQADPLLAQIPAFAGLLKPSVVAPLLPRSAVAPPARFPLVASVRAVDLLDMRRATAKVKETLSTINDLPGVSKAIDSTAASLELRTARLSVCAKGLVTKLKDALKKVVEDSCDADKGASTKCLEALKAAIGTTYKDHIGTCSNLSSTDLQATIDTEAEFLSTIGTQAAASKSSEYVLTNRPLQRLSFGVVSAFISDTSGDTRVKLQNGNIVSDPLSGALSMAVLNIHPKAYDPDRAKQSGAERFRFFVGGVFAPEFGVGAGVGVSLIRGLTINAGYAWLVVDDLRAGDTIGPAPMNPSKPFGQGTSEVLFVGLGFNFGG